MAWGGKGGQVDTQRKKKEESDAKAAWLKKTRNSPAAKSGAFSDNERWARYQASQKKKKKTSTDKPKKAGPAMGRGIKVKPRNTTTTSKKTTNRQSLLSKIGTRITNTPSRWKKRLTGK